MSPFFGGRKADPMPPQRPPASSLTNLNGKIDPTEAMIRNYSFGSWAQPLEE